MRTHNCGELNIQDVNKTITLIGWVQRSRELGGMTFIDLRDRYGITQLVFNMETSSALCQKAREIGREYIIQITGKVLERSNKNNKIPTGEIEIEVSDLQIINESITPPFTIEDESDGGDELRMKYRYLDIRRNIVKNNLINRHKLSILIRNYLNNLNFIEVETPVLIKSTPEGARDFVVPSRMNKGEFYALPQSPQQYKQLLMVAGLDRYFQIVKCFRDEDLRADRQPEFTQIDCEMSFVEQEDILNTFEGLVKHLFKEVKNIELSDFPRMTYENAMNLYGSDKPDIRFDMKFIDLTENVKGKGFKLFDESELTIAINAKGCAEYSRKQLDELTEWVKRPQIGAKGLIYAKHTKEGIKSSIDKFFNTEEISQWFQKADAHEGDLLLILSGEKEKTQKMLGELRLEMANKLNLRKQGSFQPLWVIDFPLFEWDETTNRFYAKHHPFTSPKKEHIKLLENGDLKNANANAYDLVINGVEIGGGSIRIHNKDLQKVMFKCLNFTDEEATKQFGFLMDAFSYGAPPHGGIAFGFDRLCAVMGNSDSIKDYIAFPKNNSGRDVMSESPSQIAIEQLKELGISINTK